MPGMRVMWCQVVTVTIGLVGVESRDRKVRILVEKVRKDVAS